MKNYWYTNQCRYISKALGCSKEARDKRLQVFGFIYTKLKTWQNYPIMMIEIKTVVSRGWTLTRRRQGKFLGWWKCSIWMGMVNSQAYCLNKTHWIRHLRCVFFMVCKFYVQKKNATSNCTLMLFWIWIKYSMIMVLLNDWIKWFELNVV